MSQKNFEENSEDESNGFYYWLKHPKIFMPFKFLWIGLFLTALLLFRWMDAFLLLVLGYLVREVTLIVLYPEREPTI